MASKQKHRGQQSDDPHLFNEKWVNILNTAVDDLSYLLTRGYSIQSSLQLVGNRYRLTKRQRKALWRAAANDALIPLRHARRVPIDRLGGEKVAIDGYNLLISVESGLAGGIIIECRDGSFRDLASIHGTYRKVEETLPALQLIGEHLHQLKITQAHWYLDAPVSNSGRLGHLIREIAHAQQFPWEVSLVNSPDKELAQETDSICISADGWVLDHAQRWTNMHRHIISQIPGVNIISLSGSYGP